LNSRRNPVSTSVRAKAAGPTTASAGGQLLLDSQLCFALYSTSLAMTRLYRPFLAELGLTYPQYVVMLALWEQDDLSVSAIGDRVSLDSGTLTPLLKRLESLKLIQRIRSAVDERRVHIRLTAKGDALRQQADAVHEQIACATECSGAQRREMTRSLQRLRASLLANAAG
jgi:DNA-binding MarR family transcriptional regulator